MKNPVTVILSRVECFWSDGELLKKDYKDIITFLGSHTDRLPFLYQQKADARQNESSDRRELF